MPAGRLAMLVAIIWTGCAPSPAAPDTTQTSGTSSSLAGPAALTTSPSRPASSTTSTTPHPPPSAAVSGPESLGVALLAAELGIRAPGTPAAQLAAWGRAQQQAYRDLVVNPDWRAGARRPFPEEWRWVFDANLSAGEDLRALTSPRAGLPDWHIVPPPPSETLLRHYHESQLELGVGWEYLAAIHLVETRMGRIRGTSPAGAQGPMQFLPETWEAYGRGDINDPGDAISAAARYLVAHGAPDDMGGALFAYNHSDRYVQAIEAYATVMRADERAYLGYYHWQVFCRLSSGDVLLEEGYEG